MKLGNFSFIFLFFINSLIVSAEEKIQSVPLINLEQLSPTFEEEKSELEKSEEINYDLDEEKKTPISKELNKDYSQEILKFNKEFDVVVIDGRERVQCAKNCIQALKDDGVIIWDNSDRTEYQEGYDFFDAIGFKKIDFNGLGPIGNKEWRTTIYYRSNNCFNI